MGLALYQCISEVPPPELKRVGWAFVRESGVIDVAFHASEETCVLLYEGTLIYMYNIDWPYSRCVSSVIHRSMDVVLMSSNLHPTEEEYLVHEVETLKVSLSAETERCFQMGVEIARLNAALYDANVANDNVLQICNERDEYKEKCEEYGQLKLKPLEAQLAETNRVLLEQRLQFQSVVDVLAYQRDWVREWALQCQENQRLRDRIVRHESGTEVETLRSQLTTAHTTFVELHVAFKHRGVIITQLESKITSAGMDNTRLKEEADVQKEQLRRIWKRIAPFDSNVKAGRCEKK